MNKAAAEEQAIDSATSAGAHTRPRKIGRTFERMEVTQIPKDNSIAIFVHEQNIERYRRLLQVPLDVQRRQAILALLAQEEITEQKTIRASEGERVLH